MENENLLKIVELALRKKSKRTILKRVIGLNPFYEEYKKFARITSLQNEDQIVNSFCDKVKSGEISITKTQLPGEGIPMAKFREFLDNYCLNFVQAEDKYNALKIDDLWEGMLAYGRFRWKNYLAAGEEYAKAKKIKRGKLVRPMNPSQTMSPSEVLGIKGWPEDGSKWTKKIEQDLARHRNFFDNFVLGFFRGYQSHHLEVSKKTSEVSFHKEFQKISDISPYLFDISIDYQGNQPRFHGISLPHRAKFQFAFEKDDEKGKLKFHKAITGEKILPKKSL